ncbi:MAG: tetratricopeptide repeat protein [Syntrophales bacterium]
MLASSHSFDFFFHTTESPQRSIEKAIELMQKAVALDNDHASAHSILGLFYAYNGEHDKALAEVERSLALDPSSAECLARYGRVLDYAGRPEEAIPMLQKAIRLNPFGNPRFFEISGSTFMDTGRFEEAVSAFKKAIQSAPDNLPAHLGLAATYSMMDREKEARAEAAEVLRVNPKFSLDNWARARSFYRNQSVIHKVTGALRKVGLK